MRPETANTSVRAAPSAEGEIRALTGLRALGATWVVLFHLFYQLQPYLDAVPASAAIVRAGWNGVDLFFVLSGFVIARRYTDRLGCGPAPRATARFLVSRLARVWPAWAVVTMLMVAWVWWERSQGWASEVVAHHPAVDLPSILRQVAMVQMWGRTGQNGASFVLPGWSVSAEWTAYLVFPLVAVFFRQLRRLPAVVLMVLSLLAMSPLPAIAYLHGPPNWEMHWELRISCAFTAGALAALAVSRVRRPARWNQAASVVSAVCVVLIMCGAVWASWRLTQPGAGFDHYGVVSGGFPLLVAALSMTDRGLARLLSHPVAVYGGKISYSLYLVHFPIIDIFFTISWQNPAVRGATTPAIALAAPFLILFAFCVAAATYHAVEEPGRRLVLRGLDRVLPDRSRPGLAPARPDGPPSPGPAGTADDEAVATRIQLSPHVPRRADDRGRPPAQPPLRRPASQINRASPPTTVGPVG